MKLAAVCLYCATMHGCIALSYSWSEDGGKEQTISIEIDPPRKVKAQK